jgi:hypothetical protein
MTMLATFARRSAAVGLAFTWWNELRGNRRAALGLMAVLALIAAFGILSLRDATERMRLRYAQELQHLQRVAAVAEERDWPQREAASARLRQTLEARLWTAESDGIARADIQDWISGVGREIGLPLLDIRLELTKPTGLPADMRQITATITARPAEPAVIALLDHVARAPHLIAVDRLNLKQEPEPYLEMVLVGYAKILPGTAARPRPAPAGTPE